MHGARSLILFCHKASSLRSLTSFRTIIGIQTVFTNGLHLNIADGNLERLPALEYDWRGYLLKGSSGDLLRGKLGLRLGCGFEELNEETLYFSDVGFCKRGGGGIC